jgi:hypothetical protein
MLGNRGASLTTESSAAFPSAEDASPDSPHSIPKHSGGTTLRSLKEEVSLLGTRPFIPAQ